MCGLDDLGNEPRTDDETRPGGGARPHLVGGQHGADSDGMPFAGHTLDGDKGSRRVERDLERADAAADERLQSALEVAALVVAHDREQGRRPDGERIRQHGPRG